MHNSSWVQHVVILLSFISFSTEAAEAPARHSITDLRGGQWDFRPSTDAGEQSPRAHELRIRRALGVLSRRRESIAEQTRTRTAEWTEALQATDQSLFQAYRSLGELRFHAEIEELKPTPAISLSPSQRAKLYLYNAIPESVEQRLQHFEGLTNGEPLWWSELFKLLNIHEIFSREGIQNIASASGTSEQQIHALWTEGDRPFLLYAREKLAKQLLNSQILAQFLGRLEVHSLEDAPILLLRDDPSLMGPYLKGLPMKTHFDGIPLLEIVGILGQRLHPVLGGRILSKLYSDLGVLKVTGDRREKSIQAWYLGRAILLQYHYGIPLPYEVRDKDGKKLSGIANMIEHTAVAFEVPIEELTLEFLLASMTSDKQLSMFAGLTHAVHGIASTLKTSTDLSLPAATIIGYAAGLNLIGKYENSIIAERIRRSGAAAAGSSDFRSLRAQQRFEELEKQLQGNESFAAFYGPGRDGILEAALKKFAEIPDPIGILAGPNSSMPFDLQVQEIRVTLDEIAEDLRVDSPTDRDSKRKGIRIFEF